MNFLKNIFKGWVGEKKTNLKLWLWLDGNQYKKFSNVILGSSNGTTQIDHILISQFGFFIIETKNKKGWIWGSKDQANWTQTLYNKKYSFQNPLRQTYRQKKVLAEFFPVHETYIHPIVAFVGDSTFKTKMPPNVIKYGLGSLVKSYKTKIFTTDEVQKFARQLEKHIEKRPYSKRDHYKSLKQRHSSQSNCPRCGSNLVKRKAGKGANAGTYFLGCSGFPNCRFSKNI